MHTEPRRVPAPADVRRPAWPEGRPGRRPSGRERLVHRVPRSVAVWSAVLLAGIVALVVLAQFGQPPGAASSLDRAVLDALAGSDGWATAAAELEDIGLGLGYRALWIPTALVLAWFARWRTLMVYVGTVTVIAAVAVLAVGDAAFARAVRIGVTGSDADVLLPAWTMIVLAALAAGTVYALVPPGRPRRWACVVVAVGLGVTAAVRVTLGLDGASISVASAVVGCSAAGLVFTVLAPPDQFPVVYHRQVRAHLALDATRKARIAQAVRDQLGLEVTDIHPYRLDGSAGSTPCRLAVAGGPPDTVFGKLYATTHLRSDRWYKLFRVLRYGRLEDEGSFASVRRLVEHEDYMLRLLRDGGVRVPEPIGVVEVVPGREYLLVCELVPDAVEILETAVDDAIVDDALGQVRRLWQAGAAHRDIKPSNIVVRDGQVHLVDVSFGEMRPSRWRQAVDLANMMLTLALAVGPQRVVERSRALFDPQEVAEAFAATGSVTLPRQLRQRIEDSGRDLVAEFRDLLPAHHRIPVQSWSLRRVLLAVATVGGLVLAVVLIGLNLRAGSLL